MSRLFVPQPPPPTYAQSQLQPGVAYAPTQPMSMIPPPGYVIATPISPSNSSEFYGGVKPASPMPSMPPPPPSAEGDGAGGGAQDALLPPAPAAGSATLGSASNAAAGPTYDDLAARFAALRKP